MKNDKKEQIFDAMEQLLLTVPSGEISVDAIAKTSWLGKGEYLLHISKVRMRSCLLSLNEAIDVRYGNILIAFLQIKIYRQI